MPAKKPAGARNETIRCEKCGEYYAVTYKRCPFCEDDEPTMIFRRPKTREPEEELPPRRRREEPEEDSYSVTPLRSVHRSASDEPDEYEELLNRRRPVQPEAAPPKQAQPPRRAPKDEEEEEYEEPRRRTRRRDDDEDDYEPARRRGRSKREDDYYEDEDDDDYDDYDEPRSRRGDGGKRLVTNARGGGYRHRGPSPMQIIGTVLSIALVAAAIYIVYLIVKPLFGNGETDPVPPPSQSVTVSPSTSPSGGEDEPGDVVIPSNTPDPSSQPPVVTGGNDTPPPVQTTIPSGQTATGFTLHNQWGTAVQDVTLDAATPSTTLKVVFTPEGSSGSLTWHSSKSNIVTVDESGKLTAVAQGVATITVSMAGGYTRECMVRSNVGGTPSAQPSISASPSPSTSAAPSVSVAPSPSPSTGGALSMNVGLGLDGKTYDFSLKVGESWNLKVKNAAGAVSWSVKDSSVVTVDANGKVSGVAKGNTTVTASVDGQTLECIVRVS